MSANLDRYYFTEEHKLFRESLRKFLEKEVLPYIDEWEERQQVPKSLWRKFAEQGFLGFHYPPEYGGGGVGFLLHGGFYGGDFPGVFGRIWGYSAGNAVHV